MIDDARTQVRHDGREPATSRPAPQHRDVRLRPLRRRDLRGVAAIERAVYRRPWSRTVFATELAKRGRNYVVATAPVLPPLAWPRRIVGYAGSMLVEDEAHVTTVVVRPEQRRRGVGTRLVACLLRDARERGASAATLEVRARNRPAQELYRRFGFAPVGYRRGYYDDTGEDALIMWLHDLHRRQTPALRSPSGDRAPSPRSRRLGAVPGRLGRSFRRLRLGASRGSPVGDPTARLGPAAPRPADREREPARRTRSR